MALFIENLCPNPSVEVSLAGYAALVGTTLAQDTTQGKFGHSSMKVVTDGSVSGEGFTGPSITVPSGAGTSGTISFYLMGSTGTLTISAVSGSTATIIAQTSVTLSGGDYQRVVLSGLTLAAGNQWYFLVQTTKPQALSFWVDAAQYEMKATPSAYIDGSFLNCVWEGTPGLSASNQPFQFPTSASGGMLLSGKASPVNEGQVFTTSAKGSMLLSGTESGTVVVNPSGALSDFGIWTAADMDPAVAYIQWSNAGVSSGNNAWNRAYAMVYPPQTTFGSGQAVLWKRAAYVAVGFDFKAVPASAQESLADVQFERLPVAPGTSPVPSAYTPPRQVNTIVKPTRLNYCPNPSIETSTAGWTVIGSAVLTQDNSITAAQGSFSLKVAVHAANDGAYIMIPDLIVGDIYTVGAAIQGGPGLLDVIMAVGSVSTSSAQQGIPYGGNAILNIGYGQGPYGGITGGGGDMPTGQWFAPSLTFTALTSTVCLSFQSLVGSDVSYPTEFWVDAVLVEEGETIGTYFDGSFGTDYSWESGGTANLTRSYYYQRKEVASGAVTAVLNQHVPLGIGASTPVYNLPYSQ